MITSKEIREKYIKFFVKKGHSEIPSASLIPENDPSTLFITAGMQPLVPFLLGEKHPAGKRLVNSQKCIRTGDIDEVGDKVHHTFFEMLGHWSLGDYFKKKAIEMTYELLTKDLGLDPSRIAVTVFAGNDNAPKDDQAANAWMAVGLSENKIAYLQDNWWEPDGNSGPCGPDAEPHYWSDNDKPVPDKFDPEDSTWVEIGNDVLMQYEKQGPSKYTPADQKNIDNGTGLERVAAVFNGLDDNYRTDLFWPIIEKIEQQSGKTYSGEDTDEVTRSMRVIADHLRAATFVMADSSGIEPSNVDQGYVVRKLIRRAIRHGRMIGIKDNFTKDIAKVVVDIMGDIYIELKDNKEKIISLFDIEEERFTKTLQTGLREFSKLSEKDISGQDAFNLFQTYGFPLELTQELAREKGIEVDEKEFNEHFAKHQDLSRTASAGKFKGGLAAHSEQATKYHTATHLLNAALREVLGDHIYQKGSNITDERLRFDFSHPDKLTDKQKKQVQDLVNKYIEQDLSVSMEELTVKEAKEKNAIGVFDNKYGDKVKVYTVGPEEDPVSREICGGPHVESTGSLGTFNIKKEQASSAGVRRIKAVLS